MRFSPIFGLVLFIHAAVIGLLIFQPGCQTTPTADPIAGDVRPTGDDVPGATTTVVRPGANRPAPAGGPAYSEPATLDDAFNSGFTPTEGGGASPATTSSEPPRTYASASTGERSTPRRPNAMMRDPGPEPERPDPVPVVSNTPRYETYTVQSGDSLWKIAKDYQVPLDSLLRANDLTKDTVIRVGQTLRVPLTAPELAPAPSGEETYAGTSMEMDAGTPYTVQPGDNLTKIASRFGTSVAAIKAANNRNSDVIRVGETLMIPGGSSSSPFPTSPSSSASTPGTATPDDRPTHTVRAGETPAGIAARYGMRTIDLIRMNGNFNPRRLKVGEVLVVDPAPGREPDGASPSSDGPADPPPSVNARQETRAPAPQPSSPEPIRIRVQKDEPEPASPSTDDPGDFLDDVEEIPVVPVEPVNPGS